MKYVAYIIVSTFFIVDFFIRNGVKAKAIERTKEDNHTTLFIVLAFAIIIILAEVSGYYRFGTFYNETIVLIALVIMLLGLALRVYSILKLKNSYTRMLRTTETQKLTTEGIYSYIRHPGYLGTILVWVFFGLALENYVVFFTAVFLILLVYKWRIKSEEKMLIEKFGQQYKEYQKKTYKIVPYIW